MLYASILFTISSGRYRGCLRKSFQSATFISIPTSTSATPPHQQTSSSPLHLTRSQHSTTKMSHHIISPSSIPTLPHRPHQPSPCRINTDLRSSQHVTLDVSSPSHITSFSDVPHVPLPRCPTRILESAAPGHVPEKAALAVSTAGKTHPAYRTSKFHEGRVGPSAYALVIEARAPLREGQPASGSKERGVWGKLKGKFGGRK